MKMENQMGRRPGLRRGESAKPAAVKPKAMVPGCCKSPASQDAGCGTRQEDYEPEAPRAAALKMANVAPWGSARTEMRPTSSKSVGGM